MAVTIIRDEVRHWLHHRPDSRDSDEKLCALIWWGEMKALGMIDTTAQKLLTALSNGKFTSPESIRRTRQKIQEEEPELRGKSYVARKAHTKKVKEQLGYAKPLHPNYRRSAHDPTGQDGDLMEQDPNG